MPESSSLNDRTFLLEYFGGMKISSIFAANNILPGGLIRLYTTGIFYALLLAIYGSVPPCGMLIHPQPGSGVIQRERQSRFLFSARTNNFIAMNNATTNCLSVNNSTLQTTLTERNTVSYLDFLTEKNAKNKAYAFILANGWLDDFDDYCRCSPYEDCIREIFFDTNTDEA